MSLSGKREMHTLLYGASSRWHHIHSKPQRTNKNTGKNSQMGLVKKVISGEPRSGSRTYQQRQFMIMYKNNIPM